MAVADPSDGASSISVAIRVRPFTVSRTVGQAEQNVNGELGPRGSAADTSARWAIVLGRRLAGGCASITPNFQRPSASDQSSG